MDDTGIEPVTPRMSILAYAALCVSRRFSSKVITRKKKLEESYVLCKYLKGVRQVLGVFSGSNSTASTPAVLFTRLI